MKIKIVVILRIFRCWKVIEGVGLVLRMGKVLADTLFMHKNKFFT